MGESTEILQLHMRDIWKHATDRGTVVGDLRICFKKPFNSIHYSQNIMSNKLQGSGVSASLLRLLESHLQRR